MSLNCDIVFQYLFSPFRFVVNNAIVNLSLPVDKWFYDPGKLFELKRITCMKGRNYEDKEKVF